MRTIIQYKTWVNKGSKRFKSDNNFIEGIILSESANTVTVRGDIQEKDTDKVYRGLAIRIRKENIISRSDY